MLAVLGGLIAVLLVVLVVAQFAGDDGDDAVVAGDTTTTTVAGTTTSSTDSTTTTTAATTTSSTGAPTTSTTRPATTTTAAPPPAVDGRGAVLVAPQAPERRELQPQVGCRSLATTGWTAECATFTAKGGVELAWLVETQGQAIRAFVLRRAQGHRWNVVLEMRDETGTRFADANARVVDVSGDNAADVVFGFHRRGAGDVLAVDVVEGPGAVVVHRDLRDGSARMSPGQVDVWDRCCADAFDHHTIRFTSGAWRIVATVREKESAVPPSQV